MRPEEQERLLAQLQKSHQVRRRSALRGVQMRCPAQWAEPHWRSRCPWSPMAMMTMFLMLVMMLMALQNCACHMQHAAVSF